MRLLQQPLKILKHSELEKWRILDEGIDRMIERLHELKKAHEEAKKSFFKYKLPYLYMR